MCVIQYCTHVSSHLYARHMCVHVCAIYVCTMYVCMYVCIHFHISSCSRPSTVRPAIDKSVTSIINVDERGTLTIPVVLTHPGSPQATVTFEKGGVMLSDEDSRVSIDGNTLTISDVIPDDRGAYTITATNSAGTDTFLRTVTVNCK